MGFRRGRWIAAAALTVLVVPVAMLVLPGPVLPGGGMTTITAELGTTYYVGLAGEIRRDVQLLWVQPVVRNGVQARVEVCREHPPNLGLGTSTEEGAHRLCARVEPVGFGTRVGAEPPLGEANDHLVVRLPATRPGVQTLCGVRVLYRSGWRLGFTRLAGAETHLIVGTTIEEQREALDGVC